MEAPALRRWTVSAIALGAFVGMVDATIVAVALDPITRHFGIPLASGQEVIALYLVIVTATVPTIGRLADRFGRRKAYMAGFVCFGLGSLVAAVAPSFGLLLAGRVVQAVGGGMLMAGSLAPESIRNRARAIADFLIRCTKCGAPCQGMPKLFFRIIEQTKMANYKPDVTTIRVS